MWAAEPKPSFEDTFQRDELGTNWTVAKGDWRIVDGSLVGKEKKEDAHAAVLNCNRPNHNSTIQFSFKLDGADFFHLSFNHAKGHLFRVMVTSKGIVLRTDKNKKDPASKPVTLAKDDTEIEQGKWHTMRAELNGENVTIQINDEIKLRGSHPSLDVGQTQLSLRRTRRLTRPRQPENLGSYQLIPTGAPRFPSPREVWGRVRQGRRCITDTARSEQHRGGAPSAP